MIAIENFPPLALPSDWDGEQDLAGWWLSEKYDGFRAYWNGEELLTKNGAAFRTPPWFIADLPDMPIDGELWCGRGTLEQIASIVQGADGDRWQAVSFVVFDLAASGISVEERQWELLRALRGCRHARAVSQTHCAGNGHAREMLAAVESEGGEGLVARAPGSFYEQGRSPSLLKIKSLRDAEAHVIEHRPRSIVLETDDGIRFAVNCPDYDRPALGEVVTFQYSGLTARGVPKCARLWRIRQFC